MAQSKAGKNIRPVLAVLLRDDVDGMDDGDGRSDDIS
jgi:hypothetical protein